MDIFHFTREKKERKKKREREGGGEGDMGVFSYHGKLLFLPCKPDIFLEASVGVVVG